MKKQNGDYADYIALFSSILYEKKHKYAAVYYVR